MPKYTPTSHTNPLAATVDSRDFYGQAAGELIHELAGDLHSAAPTALLKPIALDADGFPSGRASNQRVITTAAVKVVG